MKANFEHFKGIKKIGFVYDVPNQLENSDWIQFPDDATSEWENQTTLNTICETWKSLGYEVIHFPLDHSFLKHWEKNYRSCDLIHSVAEGFGSTARESWIPSLCELSGIQCIGSSPYAHSLCMNKAHLKQLCLQLKIPTSPFMLIHSIENFFEIDDSFFERSVFIKPNSEGSGMGIDHSYSICKTKYEAEEVINCLLKKYPDGILLEKYLQGPEFTSAIIGTPTQFLPIAQIEVQDGVYGFRFKGKETMEEKVSFPKLNSRIFDTIERGTRKLFSAIPLDDFARFDWKCDDSGNVYLLEVNTLAGLSYHYSVLPLMAKEVGIDYKTLLKMLADSALFRFQGRHLWYGKTRIR